MEAFARAHEVKAERAHIKVMVHSGALSMWDAAQMAAVKNMTLFKLAQWQYRWGPGRARALLKVMGATEFTECKNLTARQLDVLQDHTERKGCSEQ